MFFISKFSYLDQNNILINSPDVWTVKMLKQVIIVNFFVLSEKQQKFSHKKVAGDQ